ncbi:MAG: hydroxymethylglutaryl-CoA lyase [Nevskia sp.]|nr:hydroxymethylglutaryl-CoA lyase [Nevskia sp.]
MAEVPEGTNVSLIDVAPRDGLQNERTVVSTKTKLELIGRLLEAGLRRIEVASFVNPQRVPQMADAEALCAALPQVPDARYAGLVLNRRGFERAAATGRLHEISVVVPATDAFTARNQNTTVEDGVALAVEIGREAGRAGLRCTPTIAVAFGCPFEGAVDEERVAAIAARLAQTEPSELILADTIGVATPRQVASVIRAVRQRIGVSIPLRGHFHNTRNTAIANVYAAFEAGVTRFDASVGGVGGCPFAPAATGNVATEDVWYLFDRMDCATGVALQELVDTALWLGERLGRQLPGMVSRAGGFPQPRRA